MLPGGQPDKTKGGKKKNATALDDTDRLDLTDM